VYHFNRTLYDENIPPALGTKKKMDKVEISSVLRKAIQIEDNFIFQNLCFKDSNKRKLLFEEKFSAFNLNHSSR